MEYRRQFAGAKLDWRGLRSSSIDRRLEQWRIYNDGTDEEISHHFPGQRLALFDSWIEKMIEAGELEFVEPGLIQKAVNLTKAIRKEARRPGVKVPKEVRTERMTICRGCPMYNRAKGWCKHPGCGCLMTRKTAWASATCPVGKWGEFYETEEGKK
jgi:hypothetical protein